MSVGWEMRWTRCFESDYLQGKIVLTDVECFSGQQTSKRGRQSSEDILLLIVRFACIISDSDLWHPHGIHIFPD